MALQDFGSLAQGDPSLLRQVELIVLDGHRRLYARQGKSWSEPIAYHWLRYEDSMPVARLIAGTKKLLRLRIKMDDGAVDKACAYAQKWGYPN
ncbi:MAG TPA: hypothetical protein VGT01_00085 [Candidatus Dormibacteraeota bacterium]|nr:hypothetical protein [Candidatus Dormibacteraeota bacterium]